jgi:hypothetical protein
VVVSWVVSNVVVCLLGLFASMGWGANAASGLGRLSVGAVV